MKHLVPFIDANIHSWTQCWLSGSLRPLDDSVMLELLAERCILVGPDPKECSVSGCDLDLEARNFLRMRNDERADSLDAALDDYDLSKYISVYNRLVKSLKGVLRLPFLQAEHGNVLTPRNKLELLRRVFSYHSRTYKDPADAIAMLKTLSGASKCVQVMDPYLFVDDRSVRSLLIRFIIDFQVGSCKLIHLYAPIQPKFLNGDLAGQMAQKSQAGEALGHFLKEYTDSFDRLHGESGFGDDASPPMDSRPWKGVVQFELVPGRNQRLHDRVWVFGSESGGAGTSLRGNPVRSVCLSVSSSIRRMGLDAEHAPFSMARIPAEQANQYIIAFREERVPRIVLRIRHFVEGGPHLKFEIQNAATNETWPGTTDECVARCLDLLFP